MAGSAYETAEGSNIEIGCDGDSLTVNGIKMVLKKDMVASNGVIHLIDQVLVPDAGKLTWVSPDQVNSPGLVPDAGKLTWVSPDHPGKLTWVSPDRPGKLTWVSPDHPGKLTWVCS